ncbi:MAG: AAA family ATPase [Planctomycetes bacterium]|jgi:chromosome segregation protein|nr:AAA family ATPase [Planctomycetota bacterium]
MYLEKLEIQGFKSFANKNKLIFPGLISESRRGLTAIVGPNGSGKSNVADAIRWVLGEQSLKTLRGKKSEDVIFSGSDNRSKMSLAEVSLHLNNEEVKKNNRQEKNKINSEENNNSVEEQTSILDYSEIVLTRRLYRDGESEYLLNNNRVRLTDVQMLLAKANFGQRTYSVIGQGMVENFLNSSPADRKDFFDEATGVKQYQIKRDFSLNKLQNSYENLNQVSMLLNEIEPRLKSLTRQIEKLHKRDSLEKDLKELELKYYGKLWHELNNRLKQNNTKILELEKTQLEKGRKLEKTNSDLEIMQQKGDFQELQKLQQDLAILQEEKNRLNRQLAKLEAELEMNLEAHGQFDISWLNGKKEELSAELSLLQQEIANSPVAKTDSDLENKLQKINIEIETAHSELNKLNSQAKTSLLNKEEASKIVTKFIVDLEDILVELDFEKMKKSLQELKDNFKNSIKGFVSDEIPALQSIEEIQRQIISLSETKQKILNDINEEKLQNSSKVERLRLITEKKKQIEQEFLSVQEKLSRSQIKFDASEITKKQEEIKNSVAVQDQEIAKVNAVLSEISQKKEEEKKAMFNLQKAAHELQNEINILIGSLNDLRINSAKEETRLEDLEANIRVSRVELKEIQNYQENIEENFISDQALNKINSLKNQLELIGGIDPETEKEYTETKTRFDFLSGQVNDLNQAINSLEKIITELDGVIKERFDKEFRVISEKFNEYFKILFNGGSAKIEKLIEAEEEKTDISQGDNKNEIISKETNSKVIEDVTKQRIKLLKKGGTTGLAGIDIAATPPGKKIQSVAMLSGGERALTAIALICAIISANPSPFVVLDEVDAALDEANSERLAKILDNLSNRTQFIVITHNRASMKRASVLYGVTMQADGVSQILSVKLEEVKTGR